VRARRVVRPYLLCLGIALGIAAHAGVARAHQTSVKYVDVTVDGRRATVRFVVAPGDLTEPLGLPPDARPAVGAAVTPAVAAYVAGWLILGPDLGPDLGAAPGPACSASPPQARPDRDARFVEVAWDVACDRALDRLQLDFRGFFAVDLRHEAIVSVRAAGSARQADRPASQQDSGQDIVVRAAEPIVRVRVGQSPVLARWIAAGVSHIWEGRDHVSFVLALLLVVVLARGDGRWSTRSPFATLRRTAAIVTAFTVAHSLSLIAASLGWVRLPGTLVESLIALSILYTAVENIVLPEARWRFALTFGFGLVHGLGFASVLAVMLPPDHILAPLLGFNAGVELGQLVIVALALPLAWLAAHEIGAERYRRQFMPALSLMIAALAGKWLIERVFGIALGTFWGM